MITFKPATPLLVKMIDAILPQTQCGQCHYAGCKPYAEAIAAGAADINQCPPGGETGIRALATLLHVEYKPLKEEHGTHKPKMLAVIDEAVCIGCTLCIQACPVDAILGAAQQMHTVIAQECTGCELCLPPCPVDCISMQAMENSSSLDYQCDSSFNAEHSAIFLPKISPEKNAAAIARSRYEFKLFRARRELQERKQRSLNHKKVTANE